MQLLPTGTNSTLRSRGSSVDSGVRHILSDSSLTGVGAMLPLASSDSTSQSITTGGLPMARRCACATTDVSARVRVCPVICRSQCRQPGPAGAHEEHLQRLGELKTPGRERVCTSLIGPLCLEQDLPSRANTSLRPTQSLPPGRFEFQRALESGQSGSSGSNNVWVPLFARTSTPPLVMQGSSRSLGESATQAALEGLRSQPL